MQSSANGTPTVDNPEFRGVNKGPFTIAEIIARVEARGETPPSRLMPLEPTGEFRIQVAVVESCLWPPARFASDCLAAVSSN